MERAYPREKCGEFSDNNNNNRIYNKIPDRDWFSACLFVT